MSDSFPGPLNGAELTDARRFCGYPAYGGGTAGSGFQSWRFFEAYGVLEYRLRNLAVDELAVVRNYLAQLVGLEQAVLGAGGNLDTDQAAVWHHNRDEVRDRENLLRSWRLRLCGFLGVPAGPALTTGVDIRL